MRNITRYFTLYLHVSPLQEMLDRLLLDTRLLRRSKIAKKPQCLGVGEKNSVAEINTNKQFD